MRIKLTCLFEKIFQVKKRTREISKVFHSYHPYDHKVCSAFCLFVRAFSSLFPSLQPRYQGLSLPASSGRGERDTETLGKRLPFLHASISFLPTCLWLSKQCVILVSFRLLKVGERQTVLITEDAKDQAHFVGHNKFYDQVSHDCSHMYILFFVVVVFFPSFTSRGMQLPCFGHFS